MFAGLIEDYPTALLGLLSCLSVGITHELEQTALWANQPVGCRIVAANVVTAH